jgi:hypothetical protein
MPGTSIVAISVVQGKPSSRGEPSSATSSIAATGHRLAIETPVPSPLRRREWTISNSPGSTSRA